MELKNFMEDVVLQQLDTIIATNHDVCRCPRCRHDIAAMALTMLPARYIASPRGETYSRIKALEQQFTVNIITAITESIEIVKKYPHHEDADMDAAPAAVKSTDPKDLPL